MLEKEQGGQCGWSRGKEVRKWERRSGRREANHVGPSRTLAFPRSEKWGGLSRGMT